MNFVEISQYNVFWTTPCYGGIVCNLAFLLLRLKRGFCTTIACIVQLAIEQTVGRLVVHLTKLSSSGNVIMALEIRAACILKEVVNLIFQTMSTWLFKIEQISGRFQLRKRPENRKNVIMTFNQGVTGSRPVRPTSFSKPFLLGDFSKNQGVNSLGQPTPWFYCFPARISSYFHLYYYNSTKYYFCNLIVLPGSANF